MNLIQQWLEAKENFKKLKEWELALRKQIADFYFPKLDNGINKKNVDDKTELKVTLPIKVEIDEAAIQFVIDKIYKEYGMNVTNCIKWKPSLVKKEYNKLPDEQKVIFDEMLVFKNEQIRLEVIEK